MLTTRLAWRNAWRNPRRTGIAMTSVAVGVAGALLAMSISYGMVAQMVETAIATDLGHLQVHARGFEEDPKLSRLLAGGARDALVALAGLPEVDGFALRVRGEGLVSSTRASVGVRVLAVEPAREPSVSRLADSIVAGSWLAANERRMLVGEALARRLRADLGDRLVLSVQDVHGDVTAAAYRIGGLFHTPSREMDRGVVVLSLPEAQKLLELEDAVTEVVVLARERSEIPELQAELARALGSAAEVRTWEELQPLLIYLVGTFDMMGWYLYGAVFVAMTFGIANVLLMAVYERTREIGMMQALGLKPAPIVVAVVLESLFVTLLGLALGLAAALGGVVLLDDGIDLSRFAQGLTAYGFGTRIVPVIRTSDLWVPLVAAIVASVAASLWPALRAVAARPAESLRHI